MNPEDAQLLAELKDIHGAADPGWWPPAPGWWLLALLLLLMLALAVAGEFAVQPVLAALKEQALPKQVMESVLRDRFATWHGVASGLYVIQSVLGAVLVILLGRNK